jgi:hypothetical protein
MCFGFNCSRGKAACEHASLYAEGQSAGFSVHELCKIFVFGCPAAHNVFAPSFAAAALHLAHPNAHLCGRAV